MSNLSTVDKSAYLKRMGACWFVSYAYWDHVDKNHIAWCSVDTWPMRKSNYCNTRQYHHKWFEEILKMSDANLNTNTFGLTAGDIKKMAAELIKIV